MTNPAATQNKEIDCLSPEAQRLAEARLAAKRAARAEAREIRMKELERQQKEASDEDERMSVGSRGSLRPSEHSGHLSSSSRASSRASSARGSPVVEERPEKDFTEKGSRSLSGLSAATLASLGGTSARRGSGDTSVSVDTEVSIREIKDSLAEVEEKYKKAMVSNAQLDNEKTNYMYQVDTLKDTLLDLEEQLAESRRQCEEKSKEFEREKHAHSLLRFQLAEMKAALQDREELLQKHGIIFNSEVATNGETPDALTNAGHHGPTQTTKGEPPALQAAGDGTLGKATEVEVENEIVHSVGNRETLQNTEREPRREDPVEDGADTEASPPGDSAKDQRPSDDSAPSLAAVASATHEDQIQSQVLGSTSALKHTEQAGSGGGTRAADAGAGASLGTAASSRPRGSDDTDVPKEGDPSTGRGLETGFTNQGAAGPQEAPVQSTGLEGGGDAGEAEGKGSRDTEPVGTEAQTSPPSPTAARRAQGARGPRTAGGRSEPPDVKDPSEDNNDLQGECLDSPQKKTKNKKKKNKKKKSPAPAETPKEVKEELSFQSPGLSEAKEEEHVELPDEGPGEGIQDGVPGNPQQSTAAGSSGNQDAPECPNTQVDGKPHLGGRKPHTEGGAAAAGGEPGPSNGDTAQAAGSQAEAGGLEEGGGVAPRRPPADGDSSGSVPLRDQSPSRDVDGASPAEGTEHTSQGVGGAPESLSPGSDGLAPAGESCPESQGEAGHLSEKDKSKEDCTLS